MVHNNTAVAIIPMFNSFRDYGALPPSFKFQLRSENTSIDPFVRYT